MLQKGIIEKLEGKYRARVRVPKYDKLSSSDNGINTEDLPIGLVCVLPEMKITYAVGDVVLVAYENDELNKPVILGLLYRDSDSNATSELTYVDDTLDEINEKLSTLEEQDLHVHVKYSNDNGATFTSLFDYDNVEEDPITFYTYSSNSIEIDPNTQVMQWNIINSEDVDVTSDFEIETTIEGYYSLNADYNIHQVYTDALFKLPVLLKACKYASIRFTIKTTKDELLKHYVSLSTDKISIGDTYGDYIGICTSNDITPSLNTTDYTWTSVKEREESKVDAVTNNILDRVRNNEQDLRGYSEDITDSEGNIVISNTGLLDAINVGLDYLLIGQNRKTIYFSDANQYVDTGSSSLHINSLVQGEYSLERHSIITDIITTRTTYPEYKATPDPEETYYIKVGNNYEPAVVGEEFADETIYYTDEGYNDEETGQHVAVYVQVKPEYVAGTTYYTKSGSNYIPATGLPPFANNTIYYTQNVEEIVSGQSVEPHLKLILTE